MTCLAVAVATLISVLVLNIVKSPMVFRPPEFLVSLLSGVPGRVLFLCPLPAPRAVDHEQLTDATTPLDKQDIITSAGVVPGGARHRPRRVPHLRHFLARIPRLRCVEDCAD
ncbi:hypothetical protein HPB48_006039 [Haemaphysalis longicornis]|uniref:Uncharacterized protein n=1 Tax=Haemaphysalis longicornis TaxID=44386 RepID=A0A9J6FLY3_HAELO|nr:hypothetical protein HPB48_006039 [Haemaphysalis longicornis]